MSKTIYLDTNSYKDDKAAATSIVFEMEKGTSNKIVWFSNLNRMTEVTYSRIEEIARKIDAMESKIAAFESTINRVVEASFSLRDSIDKLDRKLDRKLKKNHYTIGDIIQATKEKVEDVDLEKITEFHCDD